MDRRFAMMMSMTESQMNIVNQLLARGVPTAGVAAPAAVIPTSTLTGDGAPLPAGVAQQATGTAAGQSTSGLLGIPIVALDEAKKVARGDPTTLS